MLNNIKDMIGENVAVWFHSNRYDYTFVQVGVVKGLASIYGKDDYLVMDADSSNYPSGPAEYIRVDRIETIGPVPKLPRRS